MYKYAKIYYEHHGDLEIPVKFKTNNGYTYDEKGKINLGKWIIAQRQHTLPESDRGMLLTQIGMIWSVRNNKQDISNICLQNNIDYEKNKVILKHISVDVFQAKITFLQSQNITIIDSSGILIDIFSMSNKDMQEKYEITLESMLKEYYYNDSWQMQEDGIMRVRKL